MPMSSLGLTSGGTLSATGGTAVTFSPNNKPIANGIELIDASQADFRLRPTIIGKFRQPVQTSPTAFTKQKVSFVLKVPKLKADGTYVTNYGRLELEFDPETTTTEQDNLATMTAQLAFDSDTLQFRRVGSVA